MQKPRKPIILTILVVLGLTITVVSVVLYHNSTKNRYGEELSIANIEDYTKGRPSNKDSFDYIKHDLFRTVSLNQSKPVKNNSIPDVLIRGGSFSQTTNAKTGVTTVKYIVDIQSLKQSYSVSYQWDANGSRLSSGIDEWGTVVRCLPEKDLIYGSFSCKDMFTVMSSDTNPIVGYLPHSTLDYTLSVTPGTAGKNPELTAKLLLSAADVSSGRDAAIATYTQEVRDYITSLGLSPDNYTIRYTVNESSPY